MKNIEYQVVLSLASDGIGNNLFGSNELRVNFPIDKKRAFIEAIKSAKSDISIKSAYRVKQL